MNNTIAYYNDTSIEVLTGTYILFSAWTLCFIAVACLREKSLSIHDKIVCCYFSKYYDAFDDLSIVELDQETIDALSREYIRDTTDFGEVIMCYNSSTSAFHYWSDNTIPFRSLDAAAQLYSLVFNCKAICVNYKSEYDKAVALYKSNKTIVKDATKITHGPFAVFKTYNMKKSRKTDNVIIPEKCNHFRKCGHIVDWDMIERVKSYGQWRPSNISDTGLVWDKVNMDCSTNLHENTNKMSYSEWVECKDKKV